MSDVEVVPEPSRAKHTGGDWKAIAQGGSSTVVTTVRPARNDNRIPSYGYRDEQYCVAYPLIEDEGGFRRDFVCFSHDDARLIAAAPDLLAFAIALDAHWTADFPGGPDGDTTIMGGIGQVSDDTLAVWRTAREAIAKALGDQGTGRLGHTNGAAQ